MERRNKRDAKFLIFQSLYIIAISILFYKGTDLSLNSVMEVKDGETVVTIDKVLKDGMKSYDTTKVILLPLPEENTEYKKVTADQEIVSKDLIAEKDREIERLNKLKTPTNRPTVTPKPNDDGKQKVTIKGER
ncbi:MAG: hypothetical protein IPM38_18090 [Ignavibacteria bacterium]|nr:hypothetical protein [Ignavibacteria bacterium]